MRSDTQLELLEHKLKGGSVKYIGIGSGKGGVGKTIISINAGEILAEQGYRVLIFDGDLGLSNIHLMYGIAPLKDLSDLLRGLTTIKELPVKVREGLYFISGGSGFHELADLPKQRLISVIHALHEYAEENYDYVIVDTPPGIHTTTITLLSAVDLPIIITTPEPTAIADAYALIKVLNREEGIKDFYLLVNKADNGGEAQAVYESIQLLATKYTEASVRYLGFLKFRKNLIRNVINQNPVDGAFKRELKKALEKLEPGKREKESFWSKILRKIGI
ncbi:AAA family ATPase [Aquifex sp.]